jgi:PIN domain nuclease of toxin-antitoxin system
LKILLDTHAALWFYLDDPRLSDRAKQAILDESSPRFISPASYWEIAIKISLGKYSLAVPFETLWREVVDDNGFQILPIQPAHAAALARLPFPANGHRDPFDRMIVAQATAEELSVVSVDPFLEAYDVERVW